MKNLTLLAWPFCWRAVHPPTASDDGGRLVTYSCDRGPDITVAYSDGSARVESGSGQAVTIPQRESRLGLLVRIAAPTACAARAMK